MRVAGTKAQGGECGGKSTQDLVLKFKSLPEAWLAGSPQAEGACHQSVAPVTGGEYELRLSFLRKSPNETMDYVVFPLDQSFVVDFWFHKKTKVISQKPGPQQVRAVASTTQKTSITPESRNDSKLDFEDESSWAKALGSAAVALEYNSEELSRFRHQEIEKNSGLPETPVELRPLRLPLLDLPPLQANLILTEKTPNFESFHLDPSTKESEEAAYRRASVQKGLNLIVSLVRKKDYLRAREAIDVLERSPQAKQIPWNQSQWWALKGYVLLELGKSLGDPLFEYRAVEIWRDGLRATAVNAPSNERPFVEYMANESVRLLFKQDLVYAVSSLLSWAKRVSWPTETEERFAYLRAEALYRLGFVEETRSAFREFLSSRKDLPISAMADRRLLPAAAFRLGDLEMKHGNYKEAIQQYTSAFSSGPEARKFSFEGNLLPEDIRLFPYTLFNRAEAFIRLGYEERALKDLRAFLHVSPSDIDVGLVYFRLGELMRYLGAAPKSIEGAWRECVYKVPGSLGGNLCTARKAADDMVSADESLWPRLIAEIEDMRQQQRTAYRGGIPEGELWTYLNLILADSFVRLGRPYQAMVRLDSVNNVEMSPYLRTWWREYAVAAYVGNQNKMIEEGRYRELLRDYEKRRTTLFVEQTRPEVLYNLARAFRALNLIKEARSMMSEAEKLKLRFKGGAPRPFFPDEQNWVLTRTAMDLDALEQRQPGVTRESVGELVARLGTTEVESLRLRLRYAQLTQNLDAQIKEWSKIEELEGLEWKELSRFAMALKASKNQQQLSLLLESRVGSWLAEKDRSSNADSPSPLLLMELLEARESNKEDNAALTVADHLLSLDDKTLGVDVSKALVSYRRGRILQKLGRTEEARQSYADAKRLSPDGVWGKLASSAQKDMNVSDKGAR